MEKNLDITKPRYSEQILPVPWPFTVSTFHCRIQYLVILQRLILLSPQKKKKRKEENIK